MFHRLNLKTKATVLFVCLIVTAVAAFSYFGGRRVTAINRFSSVALGVSGSTETTVTGFMKLANGTAVSGAVVVSQFGGQGVSGSDGSFSFPMNLPSGADIGLTAVATINGVNFTGNRVVSSVVRGGVTEAGVLVLTSGNPGGCGQFDWLPTFGAQPGVDGSVLALTVFDDGSGDGPALYAGGDFTSAGGVSANFIAKWNGSQWSAVGTGMSSRVNALTVFDDGSGSGPALYAGGDFGTAGGVSASRIAKWNGSQWSALGGGISSNVNALTVFDDGLGGGPALYAGGLFTFAGSVSANSIARWNGSQWSALGTGVNNTVQALAIFDDGLGGGPALYAGGDFTTSGSVSASRIAKWDGSQWSALGTGVNNTVQALAIFDDGSGGGPALYAGGSFTTAGGVSASRIARWNGSQWLALGTGMNNAVRALAVFDDSSGGGPAALYAGGLFTTAGGVSASRIAKWNGSQWSALGTGVNNTVQALTVFDDHSGGGPALYAGGDFTTAGGVSVSRIAKWSGSQWSATLGTGMNSGVFALTVFDDGSGGGPALYAGGDFTTAGGVSANRIAKWNGSQWLALGTGMNNAVSALTVFDDALGGGPALYAGGAFTTAGGVSANLIARWNGSQWSALVGGGMNGVVRALTVFDDGLGGGPALYAGGDFSLAGGVSARRIAKWSGSQWSALGEGITGGSVSALAVFGDGSGGGPALYAGGGFTTAGGVSANAIAKWNGSQWSALSTGMNAGVSALKVFDDGSGGGPALYAGGSFTTAGGVSASRIAKWNGSQWSALGTGLANDAVRALTVFDDGSGGGPALYAGGDFTTAGGVSASRIAKWNGSQWSALGTGVTSTVFAFTVFGESWACWPALFVGGGFGASPAGDSYIAKWGAPFASTPTPTPTPNQPPVADAGPDQTVECASSSGASVTLNGSASSDPDSNPLSFTWTGPFGTRTGAEITVALEPGTHTITLRVDDGQGGTAIDTVTVSIHADTAPPVPDTPMLPTVTGQCSATVTLPTATDDCAGTITGTTTDPLRYASQGIYTVHWTYDDGNGNIATQPQTVIVQDTTTPIITACATNKILSADAHCQAAVPDLTDEIVATDNCSPVTITQTPAAGTLVGIGNTLVTLSAKDEVGNESVCTVSVTVVDTTPPSITCPADIAAVGNIPDSCSAALNPSVATAIDACSITSVVGVRSDGHALNDSYPLGNTTITWMATDTTGNASSCQQNVTVTNPNPLVSITDPPSGAVYAVGTPVSFTGSFTDNPGGTHTGIWMFDIISQAATLVEPVGSTPGSANTTYTFTIPGVYLVTLTVRDACGGIATADSVDGLTAMVVIYDPDGGFVTGGGWINSPAGAYVTNPSLSGKANFGFVSKYQHGASIPTGQTEFQFKVANLNFSSTVYEWLVVAGARAQYKGTGTINGIGHYGFLLTAVDGEVDGGGGTDKFRIKIWDKNNGGAIVYDNQINDSDSAALTTGLGGGSIIIHQ